MELHRPEMDPSLDEIEYAWIVPWVGTPARQLSSKGNPSRAPWILRLSSKGLVEWIRSLNQ